MNNKLMLAFLIVFLVIGVSFFIRMSPADQNSSESQNSAGLENTNLQNLEDSNIENLASQDNTQESNSISLSSLSQHDSDSDCWIAYKGKVYDITSYLPRHPGSAEKIIPFCGTAEGFENAFTRKHGTSKVQLLMQVGTFIGDFDVVGDLN